MRQLFMTRWTKSKGCPSSVGQAVARLECKIVIPWCNAAHRSSCDSSWFQKYMHETSSPAQLLLWHTSLIWLTKMTPCWFWWLSPYASCILCGSSTGGLFHSSGKWWMPFCCLHSLSLLARTIIILRKCLLCMSKSICAPFSHPLSQDSFWVIRCHKIWHKTHLLNAFWFCAVYSSQDPWGEVRHRIISTLRWRSRFGITGSSGLSDMGAVELGLEAEVVWHHSLSLLKLGGDTHSPMTLLPQFYALLALAFWNFRALGQPLSIPPFHVGGMGD